MKNAFFIFLLAFTLLALTSCDDSGGSSTGGGGVTDASLAPPTDPCLLESVGCPAP